VRASLGRFIDRRLDPGRAPLVRALVIGDAGGFDPALRDLLSRSGLSHLFSISGLHFSLLAGLLYAAALCLWRRSETLLLHAPPRRFLPLALLPVLAGYLLLTGAALPTRRAFLLAAAGAGLLLWRRRCRPLALLASVALLMLLAEPLALFDPSFQLSFAGVLGILLLLPRWQQRLTAAPRPLRWTALLALTTVAATVATAPLCLHHFHLLAPAGLLTNLLAVPVVSLVAVPLGLAGALLVPLWPAAAALLLQGCGATTAAVLAAVGRVVAWPPLAGYRFYLPASATVAAALLAAALLLPGGEGRRRWLRPGLAAAGLLLLLLPSVPPPGLSVTAVSVGQGEALLLTRPDGRHYLIDGGGLPGERFDVGQRLLAPALGRLGVRALEAVVLTHDHPDHREGLQHVLEHFPVGAFWSALPPEHLEPALAEILRRRGIPALRFAPGWSPLAAGPDETFALHAPPTAEGSPNDQSLVLYCRFGRDGVLLTGDLERAGVETLLASALPGPVNLLKLPHHGSRHSEPQRLLEQLRPQLALVSAGAGNPMRLPHPAVVADLDRRKIRLLRTDRDGTIRCRSTGDGWRGEVWRRGLFR
jgi:competence protein ComEC